MAIYIQRIKVNSSVEVMRTKGWSSSRSRRADDASGRPFGVSQDNVNWSYNILKFVAHSESNMQWLPTLF